MLSTPHLQTAPVYNKAVDTGADVLTKVQTTYVYKTAANRLYPVISPYADPVIDKVTTPFGAACN